MRARRKVVLITGTSSGLGLALAKKLLLDNYIVIGISRSKTEIESDNFYDYQYDLSIDNIWKKIKNQLIIDKIDPYLIIFNAATNIKDFEKIEELMKLNFYSILDGINVFLNKNKEFVLISSSSAFKGSGSEGVGYGASKAAISVSFESLSLEFGAKNKFKTVYFGPINTGMCPFPKKSLFMQTEAEAVNNIIKVLKSGGRRFYYPRWLFFGLKIIKLLPDSIYQKILITIDKNHEKNAK